DEGPGVLSGRDVLDEHAKDARPEALAVARDLVAGLAQAKLDLVGLGPGEERAKLERQRRGPRRGRRRGRPARRRAGGRRPTTRRRRPPPGRGAGARSARPTAASAPR